MYEDHYGLSGRPFQLTPDPRFWFDTATHRKAMAYLGYGLSQGEGFIVVTGDIGAGKTTLIGHLVETADAARLNIVKLVSTQVDAENLLRTVASGLGVEGVGSAKADVLTGIERQLHAIARSGKRSLLIVDEAQGLPIASLEELRMLSNFQAGGYPLLQIFLLGQPEFRDRLQDPELEQLRQRIIASHHLGPMDADEVGPYLHHRLVVAGATDRPGFDDPAIAEMHRWSGGIPRRLNQLASRVLLHGAIEGIDDFSIGDIAAVIADLDGDMPAARRDHVAPATAPDASPAGVGLPLPTPPLVIDTPRPILVEGDAPGARSPIGAGPTEHHALPSWLDLDPAVQPPVEGPAVDAELTRRVAELETRMEEQDGALRRILTLLVDWVEMGERPDLSVVQDQAARA